jgi:hypothetical protein
VYPYFCVHPDGRAVIANATGGRRAMVGSAIIIVSYELVRSGPVG